MSAVMVKPWTNLEHWTLLTFYKGDSEENWYTRAAADMEATRKARIEKRPKGFFTPAKCKEEFDRIMAEPCPSDVPTGANYSRSAVVDAWINYFTEEDRKDAELFDELMQVKIRSYEERLMKVWGNRDSFKVEQLEKMLEDLKKEEDEVEYDEEEAEYRERLAAYYYKHVSEKFHSERDKKAASTRPSSTLPSRVLHSPRRILSQRPRDVENAGTSSSPRKSPIRSSIGEEEPLTATVKEEEPSVEKMEVDEIETKLSDSGLDSPKSQQDTKRPRGRPPKKASTAATLVDESSARDGSPLSVKAPEEQRSPTRTETRRTTPRGEMSASASAPTLTDKDPIHVIDSPAGRVRGARRPVAVDSPLLSKSSNVGRTSAGADAPDIREGSRERESTRSRQSTDTAPRSAPGVVTDDFGGTGTQTAISIQAPLSGGDGDALSSRKSSRSERRSTPATPSTSASTARSSVGVQTDEVQFGTDENIVVGWPISDLRVIVPTTSAPPVVKSEVEVLKTAHCKTDQSSRIVSWDDVLDGSYDKKVPEASKLTEERAHNWDVTFCNFSEEALQVAKGLGLTQPFDVRSDISLVSSAPKRSRKEEKLSSSPLTPKGRMMSTWNTLQEHRHSAIFLHPVTDRDAPGYSRIVVQPVDLTTLKREIDGNGIANPTVLLKKVFLMFTNAIMFNSTGHDVNSYAKEMYRATIGECTSTIDERMDPYRGHNRRSRQHDDPRRRSSLTPTSQPRGTMRKRLQ
uniref:Bromo domain-containing protein n=1 Tax=Haemonchus contortus TaxID=6289 RepID=A0A7I4Y259_HAECO